MPKKIPSYAKAFKDHSVIIIDEHDAFTQYPVYTIDKDCIEYEDGILHISDAQKFYDNNHGGFIYIFNLDSPAKVEARNLKELRRSTALSNVMNYETTKSFDFAKAIPYVIAIIAIMF